MKDQMFYYNRYNPVVIKHLVFHVLCIDGTNMIYTDMSVTTPFSALVPFSFIT